MNGISSQAASAADGEPVSPLVGEKRANSALTDDIKILPTPKPSGVTNAADAASPSMRVGCATPRKTAKPSLPAAHTRTGDRRPARAAAASRNRILPNEIRNEQAALVREQAQLNVAKSKGDKAKVSRLEQAVRDRQANIRAIQGEMGR